MRKTAGVGAMCERIDVDEKGWAALVVTIAQIAGLATITALVAHEWQSGDYVTVAGATPSDYNGVKQVTVTGDMTATFTIGSGVSTPPTGTITATFLKDAQGSVRDSWVLVAEDLAAAVVPLSAQERLAQPPALMTTRFIRFQVHNRAGLVEQQRVRWTPTNPEGSSEQVLQITGVVQPPSEDRRFLMLECVGP